MGNVREVFDVKQHPGKYGEPTPLELMVEAMEERFSKLYEKDIIDTYGSNAWGFKTPKGTRFFVNGVYEWNAVFLEYDDGEDGDRVWLDDVDDEEQVFQELLTEVESNDADIK